MNIRATNVLTSRLRVPDSVAATPAGRGDLLAAFLGAVTAIGMTVLAVPVAIAVMLLAARIRGAGLEDVAAALLNRGVGVQLIAAVLLSGTVLSAFFCGGYVAVRMTVADARRQGLLVWAATLPVPVGLNLAALAVGGPVRQVLGAVETDVPIALLVVSVAALALLGAVLGADTAGRRRTATTTPSAISSEGGLADVPPVAMRPAAVPIAAQVAP